ncbi:MAG: Nif11-like leader peptide family natural product precursor [Leptolyngbya sp. SIO1E4]|nr:Nif11-like leader peptide family natural product precursor [Leptolyngbya sp. SIO1E4]
MSATAVEEFLTKVGEDQALQTELANALQAENDRQAVTELATSKGYNFTPEELAAEVEKRQQVAQERASSGELSDEELEAVAGGEVYIVASIIMGGVMGGGLGAGAYGLGKAAGAKW